MNNKNMIHNGFIMLSLFLLFIAATIAPASAEYTEVNSITRTLPDNIPTNNEISVVLEIDSQIPFVAGIVETIPEGFTFPDNKEDISTSCEFKLDRENRKISFCSINVTSITYKVIASSESGAHTFSGNWVDLLVQSTELDEGTERWEKVVGDKTIIREAKKTSSTSSSTSPSFSSNEKYENIAKKNVAQQYLSINNKAEYTFNDEANPITEISFMPLKNGGTISTTIEVLKDVSGLVEISPHGTVYKNMNIWISNDWASESTISETKIAFCVDKEWLNEYGIDSSSIKLMRYTSKWTELPTTITGEDENRVYFVAETPGFSPFAITSISEKSIDLEQTETKSTIEEPNIESDLVEEETVEPQEELPAKTPGFTAFLGCAMMAVGFMITKKMSIRR
ncbi:PGF-pre-PGF domain-containing protein [Methanococcoides vulcani]|uniref:PGF-pre-PGF domain-containing protein n=1 Tax=Methanococcoides vulcani TaxID=1353158 RepID=A0A1I0BUP4_9EURY|nr:MULTISPECIES: PGF-pre-PGF domain-containing protein [Methanococcoides]SET10788.1 PGF-pre-PGF domain-containing protein [Methanococcoides vulcani]